MVLPLDVFPSSQKDTLDLWIAGDWIIQFTLSLKTTSTVKGQFFFFYEMLDFPVFVIQRLFGILFLFFFSNYRRKSMKIKCQFQSLKYFALFQWFMIDRELYAKNVFFVPIFNNYSQWTQDKMCLFISDFMSSSLIQQCVGTNPFFPIVQHGRYISSLILFQICLVGNALLSNDAVKIELARKGPQMRATYGDIIWTAVCRFR